MKKIVIGLGIGTGVVALVLVGFLIGSNYGGGKPREEQSTALKPGDKPVSNKTIISPPPPPPPITDPLRVKENLKPGQTYLAKSQLAMNLKGTDTNWGFKWSTRTMGYLCRAEIARKIVSNDGTNIVEERTFRAVTASKFNTQLEDVRLDLGERGNLLLGGIALVDPSAGFLAASATSVLEGPALRQVITTFGWDQAIISRVLEQDPTFKFMRNPGRLQGKVARLRYRNDRDGEITIEPIQGDLSPDEVRFLMSSSLLADSHIFPNSEVKENETWVVDGIHFLGMIDPSLLARTEGQLTLRREPVVKSAGVDGQLVPIKVVAGELLFNECNPGSERVGNFRPEKGELKFSTKQQIIVRGFMKGRGKISIQSRDHLLFEVRSDREPDVTIHYECSLEGAQVDR